MILAYFLCHYSEILEELHLLASLSLPAFVGNSAAGPHHSALNATWKRAMLHNASRS